MLAGCQSVLLKDGSLDKPKPQVIWQLDPIPYLDVTDYPNDPVAKKLKAREIGQEQAKQKMSTFGRVEVRGE
ncbi:hypothetical protein EKG38_22290 [Shewanella canadensis]|uniref:Uncharacterized protein n=2 Tax=Shewanella canadensis TaxID=271096 RepID=A0A3S0RUR3_9GAMM|nr:hypothetical protein EKG38_22290 [Shewanella canadensis]